MADKPKPASFAPFFILIAIIIALWAFGGGTNLNNSNNYQAPTTIEGISNEVVRIDQETQVLQKEADKNKLIGPLSSLNKYLSLQSGDIWSTDPQNEYVELNVSSNAPARTLLTGFEIKSAITGRGVLISKGVYRPQFSQTNTEDPIYLSPGDKVYLISGKSPLGYSFKVNKCTGYFAGSQQYAPYLPRDCPAPRDEKDLPNFGANRRNACLDYIEGLGNCSLANPDFETSLSIGPECVTYVTTKIGYDSCVYMHKLDPDFYKPEWRVYLGRPEELWDSRRELIKLLDLNKQTVGYLEY